MKNLPEIRLTADAAEAVAAVVTAITDVVPEDAAAAIDIPTKNYLK